MNLVKTPSGYDVPAFVLDIPAGWRRTSRFSDNWDQFWLCYFPTLDRYEPVPELAIGRHLPLYRKAS